MSKYLYFYNSVILKKYFPQQRYKIAFLTWILETPKLSKIALKMISLKCLFLFFEVIYLFKKQVFRNDAVNK